MPPIPDAEAVEPDDQTVPRQSSVACRRCGLAVAFDVADDDGTVTCASCGAVSIVPDAPDAPEVS